MNLKGQANTCIIIKFENLLHAVEIMTYTVNVVKPS